MTRKQRRMVICLAVALTPVVGWLTYRALRPKLYRVSVLPALGGSRAVPRAINDRGEIVGVAQEANGDWHLVLWDQAQELHDLGPLEAGRGWQVDINNRGQIAGFKGNPRYTPDAFLRDPNGSTRWLDPCGVTVFYGGLLNNQGQIAGKLKGADGAEHLCLWDEVGGMQDLGAAPGQQIMVGPINDKGQVLGYGRNGSFLWDPNDGVTDVDVDSAFCDLNNHSCVFGWRRIQGSGQHMMMWRKGKELTTLFTGEPGLFKQVIVNDANQVLCGHVRHSRWERFSRRFFGPSETQVLWDPTKGRTYLENHLPWYLRGRLQAMGLNNRGCIIAVLAHDDYKQSRAIVMEPIPKRWGK